MDIITIFWVRGKIEPKNVPVGIGCLRGLLKKRLLLSGDSKSLALLGYYYTIEGHHLILHCQNWWTLPLNSSFTFQRWDSHFNSVVRGYQITGTILFFFFYKVTKDWGGGQHLSVYWYLFAYFESLKWYGISKDEGCVGDSAKEIFF